MDDRVRETSFSLRKSVAKAKIPFVPILYPRVNGVELNECMGLWEFCPSVRDRINFFCILIFFFELLFFGIKRVTDC